MLLTVVVFVLVLGVLIFVHEFGHFIIAKREGLKVDEFGFGFPPRLLGIKKGETTYSINLIPIGGFVRILGEQGENPEDPKSFASKSPGIRAKIVGMGVVMNFLLAAFLLIIGFKVGLPTVVSDEEKDLKNIKVQIMAVEKNSPAEAADFRIWDEIVFLDGNKVEKIKDVQDYIEKNKGKEIILTIKRGKDFLKKKVIPRENPPQGQGPLGVGLVRTGIISHPLYQAIWMGIKATVTMIVVIVVAFFNIIKELVTAGSITAEIAGPVGIAVITGQVAKMGWIYILNFTAILSINLGIINALPFPALDGGRLLFLLIEKIRGRKVDPKIENIIHTIGFILLILLIVLVTYRDIMKFGGRILKSLKSLIGISKL